MYRIRSPQSVVLSGFRAREILFLFFLVNDFFIFPGAGRGGVGRGAP